MKNVINFLKIFFLTIFFQLASFNASYAEIIDIQKEERSFGDWKVYCEVDVMMDNAHCKIGSKFYDNGSVVTIEPAAKSFNQFFIVIPQIKVMDFVKIRVDRNDLIFSKNVAVRDFGLIPLDNEQKNTLYNQMKNGDFLFLRFNVKNSDKEITTKINLKDFRSALNYYNSRTSNNH